MTVFRSQWVSRVGVLVCTWAFASVWIGMLTLPLGAMAQGGTTVIFGKPCDVYDDNGNVIGTMPCDSGAALTCANASASAAQGNTGQTYTVTQGDYSETRSIPGLQRGYAGTEKFPDAYLQDAPSFNPITQLNFDGNAARPAPSAWTSGNARVWADAPAGSGWVTSLFEGEPLPTGPETLYSVFMGAWYIPTEADAKKMRVKLTYRADDALIGVYLNDITANGNLLTAPITRDTSSVGTEPATIELKGFQQGTNLLSFVVSSTQGATQKPNYPGFAAAFDAYCFTPTLTVKKLLAPSSDPGKFTLQINGAPTATSVDIGNGGTTGGVVTEAGTPVTVAEVAGAGTSAADYNAQLTCDGVTGVTGTTSGSFTMPDADVTCTFNNTRKAAPAPVPTLSLGALAALMSLVLGAAAVSARKAGRRR